MGDPSGLRYVPPSVANIPIDWSRVPESSKRHILRWAFDWENEPLPATIADLAKWFNGFKFFGYFDQNLRGALMDISEFGLKAAPGEAIQVGPRFYMKYLEQVWFLLFTPGERKCVFGWSDPIIIEEEDKDTDDGEYMSDEEKQETDEDMDDEKDQEDDEDMDDEEGDDDMQDEVDGLEEEAKEAQEHEEVKEHEKEKKDNEEVKEVKEADEEDDSEDEDFEPEEPGAAKETILAQQFDVNLEEDVLRGMVASVVDTKKLGGWRASMLPEGWYCPTIL